MLYVFLLLRTEVEKKNRPVEQAAQWHCKEMSLTLLEPESRFGDKAFKFQVVCPQHGTAVLKGLRQ